MCWTWSRYITSAAVKHMHMLTKRREVLHLFTRSTSPTRLSLIIQTTYSSYVASFPFWGAVVIRIKHAGWRGLFCDIFFYRICRNTVRSSRTQTNSYTGQLVYKELFSYVLQALKSINFNLKKKEVNFNEFENEAE